MAADIRIGVTDPASPGGVAISRLQVNATVRHVADEAELAAGEYGIKIAADGAIEFWQG